MSAEGGRLKTMSAPGCPGYTAGKCLSLMAENVLKKLLVLVASLALGACAATGPTAGPAEEALPLPALTLELGDLPGASVQGGESPVISYPEQSLFAPAAVVPQVGSEAILDPLIALLRKHNGWRWEATVRAVSAYGGEYDRKLAEGRARLLKRYFSARGLPPGRVRMTPLGEAGTPFELRPVADQSSSPDSSSGVKE